MTDFYAQVHGVDANGFAWSTGNHITSGQTRDALLATWQAAWTSAWNLAGTGLKTVYTTQQSITRFSVKQLNATMREVSESSADVTLAGTDAGNAVPASMSIVVRWFPLNGGIERNQRGFNKLLGPAKSQTTNDDIDAGPAANVKAAMDSVRTAIQADGSTFFSFPRNDLENGTPAFTKTVLATLKVRRKLGSADMRDRKEVIAYV
jgi:hypothetical protein